MTSVEWLYAKVLRGELVESLLSPFGGACVTLVDSVILAYCTERVGVVVGLMDEVRALTVTAPREALPVWHLWQMAQGNDLRGAVWLATFYGFFDKREICTHLASSESYLADEILSVWALVHPRGWNDDPEDDFSEAITFYAPNIHRDWIWFALFSGEQHAIARAEQDGANDEPCYRVTYDPQVQFSSRESVLARHKRRRQQAMPGSANRLSDGPLATG